MFCVQWYAIYIVQNNSPSSYVEQYASRDNHVVASASDNNIIILHYVSYIPIVSDVL